MFKFFDRRSHPEKKEVKVGILKVADYGSFPEAFINFMSAETEEDQVLWWEIMEEAIEDEEEKYKARALYMTYFAIAEHLQREYIETDSAMSKMELHNAIITHDTRKVSSHDYIVVLTSLVHLQDLLDIEYV